MNALRPSPWNDPPHGLWSLWNMISVYAEDYIDIGRRIADARAHWGLREGEQNKEKITEYDDWLREDIKAILKICETLSLKTSDALLRPRVDRLPASAGEFDILMEAVESEIKGRMFLYVPANRA